MPGRKVSLILTVVVAVAALMVAYIGAYYGMVNSILWDVDAPRSEFYWIGEPTMDDLDSPTQDCLRSLFRPMNWLDRRARPRTWDPIRTEEFAPAG
ncbi:MAG: hypothetical protein IT428_17415 [Planctomycetaceae bacterium]|nr:hypothetical protein [Planctomycetaceae bacterium]